MDVQNHQQPLQIYFVSCTMQQPQPPHVDDPHVRRDHNGPTPAIENVLAFGQRSMFDPNHRYWQVIIILAHANLEISDLDSQTSRTSTALIWPNRCAMCICNEMHIRGVSIRLLHHKYI